VTQGMSTIDRSSRVLGAARTFSYTIHRSETLSTNDRTGRRRPGGQSND
jgi:hypothetical protein